MHQPVKSWLVEGQQLNRLPHDFDEWTGVVKMKESFGKILKQPTAKKSVTLFGAGGFARPLFFCLAVLRAGYDGKRRAAL